MKRVAAALSSFLVLGVVVAKAQDTAVQDGAFTDEQAQRGKALYEANCAGCHGYDLVSADGYAPTLTEPAFKFSWQRTNVGERYERIRSSMPAGQPGKLTDQEYLDVISYILEFNGYPTGDEELTPDDNLDDMPIKPLS